MPARAAAAARASPEGNAPQAFAAADRLPVQPALPDPLVMLDGTPVITAEVWNARRKPELKALFQHYMYGYLPPAPAKIAFTIDREDRQYFGGKATLREISIRFGPDGTPPIRLLLVVPNGDKPAPVFVGLNFNGNHTLLNDPAIALPTVWMPERSPGTVDHKATDAGRGKNADVWNVEYVVGRGYALASFYCGDLDPDRPDFTDGVHPHYFKPGQTKPGPHDWGAVAAWAYGVHRVVDYLQQDKSIDAARIAVVGHSRLGKAALFAGAFDERIALVIPSQAGCGGTAPSRGTVGESVKQINDRFPHWFNDTFPLFNDDTAKLPFDQHCLIALCAPRPVLLSNAVEDQWANPAGQFEMLRAADPVYRLLGSGGLHAQAIPEVGTLVDGPLGYWIRPGKHAMTKPDWETFVRFADEHFATAAAASR
jgi:hypothetical protein